MMVLLLCCTYNRHTCLEKAVRFYLDQDYKSDSLLFIYNNSPVPQQLDYHAIGILPVYKNIVLKNNFVDQETGKTYKNVGDIHRDALRLATRECLPVIVNFFEDDNYYLPDHITCGVEGMKRAYERNCVAYKPQQSFMNTNYGIGLHAAVFEPSYFIDYEFLKEHGFKRSSVDFHFGWITPLLKENKLFTDELGKPTLIYNYGNVACCNLSAMTNNGIAGMLSYRQKSQDVGDRLITPISEDEAKKYYALVQ